MTQTLKVDRADLTNRFDVELAKAIVEDGLGATDNELLQVIHLRPTTLEPGRLTVEAVVTPEVLNPFGVAHGGVTATLVDHCVGVVAWPLAAPGSWPATTQVSIHYLAPARPGPIGVDATVRFLKGNRAIVEVEVTSTGRTVAVGTGEVTFTGARGERHGPGTK